MAKKNTKKVVVVEKECAEMKECLAAISGMEEREEKEHISLLAKVFSNTDIEILNKFLVCYFDAYNKIVVTDDITEVMKAMQDYIPRHFDHKIKTEIAERSKVYLIGGMDDESGCAAFNITIHGYPTMRELVAAEYPDFLNDIKLRKSDKIGSRCWSLWTNLIDSAVLNDLPLSGKDFETLAWPDGNIKFPEIYDVIPDFKRLFRCSKYYNISAFMERNSDDENYAFLRHFLRHEWYGEFHLSSAMSSMLKTFRFLNN